MAKSDDLIAAAQEKASQARLAEIAEADNVKAILVGIITKNIENWLGEFAAELVINQGNPGDFFYRPTEKSDVNAAVDVNFVWRDISTGIRVKAHNNQVGGVGANGVGVELMVEFPEERIGRKLVYAKHFSLDLPCRADRSSPKWVFPEFSEAVGDEQLAYFLVKVMAFKEERDRMRLEWVEECHRDEQQKLFNDYGNAIGKCETELDAQDAVDAAFEAFPDEAGHWKDLHEAIVMQIRKRQAEHDQYLTDRLRISEWIAEYMKVLRHNRRRLAKIQADYTYDFEIAKLTFGIVVSDDEGDPVVEQDYVYIDPDATAQIMGTTRWIWVSTAERPQRRICIANPIKVEILRRNIESIDKGSVCSTWVPQALSALKTPIVIDPVTFQAELDQAEFLDFPICELSDIREHRYSEKALNDALKLMCAGEDDKYGTAAEIKKLYYSAPVISDEKVTEENNNEFPF